MHMGKNGTGSDYEEYPLLLATVSYRWIFVKGSWKENGKIEEIMRIDLIRNKEIFDFC